MELSDFYDRHALIRHFVHEPLFLLAIGAVTLTALAVPFVLSKRWNPAPPNFSRSVSVSLLDYAQSWALRRSATTARKEGRWDDALGAARGAMGNNIADAGALRIMLELLRDAPSVRSANLPLLLLTSRLMLELERTNRVASTLVADVFERFRMPEYALNYLQPWQSEFTVEERRVWLKCLVSSGRIQQFNEDWKTNHTLFAGDDVMATYVAGADTLLGASVERSVAGLDRLHAALTNPPLKLMAARLLGAAAVRRNELPEYERAIVALRELKSTMVFDEVLLWQLLSRNGRLAEARELASKYPEVPPPTAIEAVQLVRAWLALGLDELGVNMFRENASRYGLDVEVWSTYLDLLTLRQDWKDVRAVASMLRVNTSTRDDLLPISLYADARADLADGRKSSAHEFLRRLRDARIADPRLAFRIAAGVNAAEEPDTAIALLKRVESDLGHLPDYWLEVIGAAQRRREIDEMQRGSEKLVELLPENPTAQMIRLVVLLGSRSQPGEALAVSLKLLSRGIDSPAMQINHSMALLLNNRVGEAAQILATVSVLDLNAADLNSWLVAQVECHARLGRHREAVDASKGADASLLMPPQEKWFREVLDESRRKLAAGPAGK